MNEGILNFVEAYNIHNHYIGYVAITYRSTNNPSLDLVSCHPYILNSKHDGWFRKNEGLADGYGLCINNVKITSRKPMVIGDFLAYKVAIDFTNNDEIDDNDIFWLYVENKFDIKDVMEYIEKTKDNWYP